MSSIKAARPLTLCIIFPLSFSSTQKNLINLRRLSQKKLPHSPNKKPDRQDYIKREFSACVRIGIYAVRKRRSKRLPRPTRFDFASHTAHMYNRDSQNSLYQSAVPSKNAINKIGHAPYVLNYSSLDRCMCIFHLAKF